MALNRVDAGLYADEQHQAQHAQIQLVSPYQAVEEVHWQCRRGSADVLGDRAEALEDQSRRDGITDVGHDSTQCVDIPTPFAHALARSLP